MGNLRFLFRLPSSLPFSLDCFWSVFVVLGIESAPHINERQDEHSHSSSVEPTNKPPIHVESHKNVQQLMCYKLQETKMHDDWNTQLPHWKRTPMRIISRVTIPNDTTRVESREAQKHKSCSSWNQSRARTVRREMLIHLKINLQLNFRSCWQRFVAKSISWY